MKPQQQFKGLFKFLFAAASILLLATIILFALGKVTILSFFLSLASNVLTLTVAVMMLRRG